MTKTKKGIPKGGLIAGAAGLAAIGAGAYYLLGPKAKEHQKKARALVGKIKKEVEKEAKKAKALSIPLYHKAVDAIGEKYAKEYKAHEKEIKDLASKLKGKVKSTKAKIKKTR